MWKWLKQIWWLWFGELTAWRAREIAQLTDQRQGLINDICRQVRQDAACGLLFTRLDGYSQEEWDIVADHFVTRGFQIDSDGAGLVLRWH